MHLFLWAMAQANPVLQFWATISEMIDNYAV